MENKFTPGPWTVVELNGGHNFSIVHQETGIHLANVGDKPPIDSRGCLAGKEILANAHLIAAAPDLLESLSDLMERANKCRKILQESSINPGYWGVLDTEKAKSAINKALNK